MGQGQRSRLGLGSQFETRSVGPRSSAGDSFLVAYVTVVRQFGSRSTRSLTMESSRRQQSQQLAEIINLEVRCAECVLTSFQPKSNQTDRRPFALRPVISSSGDGVWRFKKIVDEVRLVVAT